MTIFPSPTNFLTASVKNQPLTKATRNPSHLMGGLCRFYGAIIDCLRFEYRDIHIIMHIWRVKTGKAKSSVYNNSLVESNGLAVKMLPVGVFKTLFDVIGDCPQFNLGVEDAIWVENSFNLSH